MVSLSRLFIKRLILSKQNLMINHFRIILRRNLRNWASFSVNVIGLSVGIAAAFIILNHVGFETTYDSDHENSDKVYRLILNNYASTNAFIGPHIKDEFPEVTDFTRVHRASSDLSFINQEGEQIRFHEDNVLWADNSFFDFFSFELVQGNEKTVLKELNSMVLSESLAKKYFGNENPLGKMVTFGRGTYTITGIIKDLPDNTHLKFDILISLITLEQNNPRPFEPATGLRSSGFFTYLMFNQAVNNTEFETKVTDYLLPILKREECEVIIQQVKDIHLKSTGVKMDIAIIGDIDAVNYLFLAACLILILAWTNHINLIVYQNSIRIKEFGIKKTFGASRANLTRQIVLETLFIQVVALLLAFLIYDFVASNFESLFYTMLGTESIPSAFFTSKAMLIFFIMMTIGVFISFYVPSIVMAKCRIIASLENKIEIIKGLSFRKAILLFQYAIIIVLSIVSLGIYEQISFLNNKDYGIEIKNALILRTPRMSRDSSRNQQFNAFKSTVLKSSNVTSIVLSSDIPGKNVRRKGKIANIGEEMDEAAEYNLMFVENQYLSSYGLSILAGHDFSKSSTAKDNIIINESALYALGYTNIEDAIQQNITTFWGAKFTIIGVVNDYHHLNPKYNFEPTVFLPLSVGLPFGVYYTIKFDPLKLGKDDYGILLSDVKEKWNTFFPERAFNYYFLEDSYQEQITAESNFQGLLFFLTAVSMVLTCLGILGLSSLLAAQKLKEIAIRKILGASIISVYLKSLGGVVNILLISCIFSGPIAFFGLGSWLNNYAARIEVGLWTMLIPLILIFILTVVTASFHILRAVFSNPTKVLAQ